MVQKELEKLTDNMICLELCSGCETGGHYLGNQANCQIHKEIKRAIPIIEERERERILKIYEEARSFIPEAGLPAILQALKQSKEIPCPDCGGSGCPDNDYKGCAICEFMYKNEALQVDCALLNHEDMPDYCYMKKDCPTCKGTGKLIEQSKEE